jgi:hypothetical protein
LMCGRGGGQLAGTEDNSWYGTAGGVGLMAETE